MLFLIFFFEYFCSFSYRLLPRIEGEDKGGMQRVRSPRYFPSTMRPLEPYLSNTNRGYELLNKVNLGKYKNETYLWHGRAVNSMIILTAQRLLIIEENYGSSDFQWQCPIADMMMVQIEMDKMAVNSIDLVQDSIDCHSTHHTAQQRKQQCTDRRTSRLRNLTGRPTLHLFHATQRTPGFRANNFRTRGSSIETLKFENSKKFIEGNKNKYENENENENEGMKVTESLDSTDRLIHRTLRFHDHESLFDFLQIFFELAPILKGEATDIYFAFCGIQSTNSNKKDDA